MENNKKYIFAIILLIIVVVAVGTFAWMTYRTNKTAMVLTIGDITTMEVRLTPYQIKGTLSEVTAYTSGVMTDVTAKNSSSASKKFNLYYRINSIDTSLASASLKYTITRSTNGGTSYSTYKNGNFVGTANNNNLVIMEETLPAGQTYKYKVYLWLNSGSSGASGSFDGELRAEVISLPSGYQRVEYIKSSGSQYIMTSIVPTNTHGVYAKIKSTSTSSDLIFFGSKGSTNNRFWVGNSNGTAYFGWNSVLSTRPSISASSINTIQMNYMNDRRTIFNGSVTQTNLGTLASNTTPITIFAGNANGTPNYKSSIELYELKISNSTDIIANFVPCYRIDDALNNVYTPGLYDTVTNTFYGNNGTGAFTYGAAV